MCSSLLVTKKALWFGDSWQCMSACTISSRRCAWVSFSPSITRNVLTSTPGIESSVGRARYPPVFAAASLALLYQLHRPDMGAGGRPQMGCTRKDRNVSQCMHCLVIRNLAIWRDCILDTTSQLACVNPLTLCPSKSLSSIKGHCLLMNCAVSAHFISFGGIRGTFHCSNSNNRAHKC